MAKLKNKTPKSISYLTSEGKEGIIGPGKSVEVKFKQVFVPSITFGSPIAERKEPGDPYHLVNVFNVSDKDTVTISITITRG